MIKQGNLVDLYNLLAIGAVQKSLVWSEWKKFPSKAAQGTKKDPLHQCYRAGLRAKSGALAKADQSGQKQVGERRKIRLRVRGPRIQCCAGQ